jgi:hypothetical protein
MPFRGWYGVLEYSIAPYKWRILELRMSTGAESLASRLEVVRDRTYVRSQEKKPMPLFEIESPHTKEECASGLRDLQSQGKEVLGKFVWGCQTGNHIGWATVEAQNENAARELVPRIMRDRAKLTRVEKYTPEQVNELLKKHV